MSLQPQIFISLGSFGASEVRRHGQNWFVHLCHDAGADGVEIRGELLTGGHDELLTLAASVRDLGMDCVYSSPAMLWDSQSRLATDHLEQGLLAATTLGAGVLKMSIGGFSADQAADTLPHLAHRLAGQPVKLLIENDQTESAGTLPALQRFFQRADQAGLNLGMTFDMGNWHWLGECSLQASAAFAGRVQYVHCKGVQRQPQRWVAVPLTDSAVPWRAVLRALPGNVPRAIEYPLVGEDLTNTTRAAVQQLRVLEVVK